MATIKFWPNKKKHTIDVEVNTESATVKFSLDLEDAADASVDLSDAVSIVTTDWIEE